MVDDGLPVVLVVALLMEPLPAELADPGLEPVVDPHVGVQRRAPVQVRNWEREHKNHLGTNDAMIFLNFNISRILCQEYCHGIPVGSFAT